MVLVVDDHPDTCIALTKLLRRSGFPAEFVTSGQDALGFMSRQVPKLVILDVMMPDMNGIDVLRAIRSNLEFENVAVMMYSADAAASRQREAMRDGAQAYLIKGSMGWDQLMNEVRRFV